MFKHLRDVKALILVGGLGSRLQPITFTTPKPLIPLGNKPMIEHQIEALVDAGIVEIILAMKYKYKSIVSFVNGVAKKFGVRIIYSLEEYPLGTAGPIALARKHLVDCSFFVLNSDIICSFPLRELLNFHKKQGLLGTILSTCVEDPRNFGVIKGTPVIESFVEKPTKFVGKDVNAGIYVFEYEVLEYFSTEPSSIEKDVFPRLAEMRQLSVLNMKGFWMDVGTLKSYIVAQRLYLEEKVGPVVGEGVKIGNDVEIGKYVAIGRGTTIGDSVILRDCAVFEDTWLGDDIRVFNSIIGKGCCIEGRATISNSIIGDKTILKFGDQGKKEENFPLFHNSHSLGR